MKYSFLRKLFPVIKAVPIALKFVCLIYLAAVFSSDDYVTLLYIIATYSFLAYIYGMEFYTLSIRSGVNDKSLGLRGDRFLFELLFYLAAYLIFIPASYWYLRDELNVALVVLIIFLSLSEHISLEVSRRLIANGHLNVDAIIYTFKNSSWPLLVFAFGILHSGVTFDFSLHLLLFANSAGALLYAVFFLKYTTASAKSVDGCASHIKLLKRLPWFLLVGISYRTLFWLDKNIAKSFTPLDSAAYMFSFQLAAGIATLLEIALFSRYLADCNRDAQSSDHKNTSVILKFYIRAYLGSGVVLIPFILFLGYCASVLISKDAYFQTGIIICLSVSFVFGGLANIYNYQLYLAHKDIEYLISSISPLLCFFGLMNFFSISIGIHLALVLCASNLLSLGIAFLGYRKSFRNK